MTAANFPRFTTYSSVQSDLYVCIIKGTTRHVQGERKQLAGGRDENHLILKVLNFIFM